MTRTDTLAALVALLDDEYRALRHADYSELGHFAARKEALSATLAATGTGDRAGLQKLAQKAARNAGCLRAAGRGVRAARLRMDELRRAVDGGATYDCDGRRSHAATVFARTERRA